MKNSKEKKKSEITVIGKKGVNIAKFCVVKDIFISS